MTHRHIFPFAALVGQEQLKLALTLNAVNPLIGGVLIRGEKGTAKSTAVRALAALLPDIDVFAACPLGISPDEAAWQCGHCRMCSPPRRVVRRRVRTVTLPLNATEDRVAGGIDFRQAIRSGRRVLQPGLLARAHRGILYVDEVNLLDDHIVDMVLDAAASGLNRLEREGISFSHPSRFILVGTMNPEEGELRPQLLDRFGLCVDVAAETDPARRVLTMERREAFDRDPAACCRAFADETGRTAENIRTAAVQAPHVVVPDSLRSLIAEMSRENNVAGHRADLVIEQAAKALAALRGRDTVSAADIVETAPLAYSHRRRDAMPPPPEQEQPENEHAHPPPDDPEAPPDDPPDNPPDNPMDDPDGNPDEPEDPMADRRDTPEAETAPPEDDGREPPSDQEGEPEPQDGDGAPDQVFEIGETFKVRKFATSKDRVFRRGSGRRSRTRVAQKQGRYVKSAMGRDTGDIALDATLRAAAPYQLRRKNGNGLAVKLRPEDVREKIREKRVGNFLLFLVDASGSMGARGRMAASKGAVMSLLLDAYQKRDRVGMISFRKDEATVNLPPTSSIELAAAMLKDMPVGGRTPLSAGLVKSYEVLRNYLMREPTARPIVIVITDGKSNKAVGDAKPAEEARQLAERLSLDGRVRFIVVDTESQGLVNFGLARGLSEALGADYFKITDLKADTLLNIVKGDL